MANKNFRVRNGIDIGDGLSISDTATFTTTSNGNITLDPNGTGDIVVTLANGGNLTNDRNYVFGTIRNSTTESIGDIWAVNSTGPSNPFRGVSLSNSADTTRGPATLLRSYSGGAVSGSGTRGRFVFEKARGTAAAPTAVQNGDVLGSVDATGYTSTGWINDNVSNVVPAFYGFIAAESWVSNTNLGTQFLLSLAPTATTITSNANLIETIRINPQNMQFRSDLFAIGRGKTSAFTATGCSVSGTTLTIGTVTSGTVAVGQLIQNSLNTFPAGAYIVSGSGSTWTVSTTVTGPPNLTVTGNTGFIGSPSAATSVDALSDLRLLTNTIEGSTGTTQIVTSASGTTLELRGNNIQLEDASGTSIKGGDITYRRTFGCFHKVADVTAVAANTVYEFDWYTDTTAHVGNQGVTVTSGNPSRINIDTAASYDVFIEMQAKNTDNAERTAWIWIAKNGTDITETRIKVTLRPAASADTYQLISKAWCVDGIADNDYLEVRFAVDNISGISLEYEAAQVSPFAMPAMPSATITVSPIGA